MLDQVDTHLAQAEEREIKAFVAAAIAEPVLPSTEPVTCRLLSSVLISGQHCEGGSVTTLPANIARDLLRARRAISISAADFHPPKRESVFARLLGRISGRFFTKPKDTP